MSGLRPADGRPFGPWLTRGRNAGRALVAFGLVGLTTTVALAALTLVIVGPLLVDAAALEAQRGAAIAALDGAAGALDAMATTVGDVQPSLAQSEAAIRDAAAATSQLADAAAGQAVITSAFAETTTRTRTLSDDLTRTADALARNEADAGATAGQLTALAAQVRSLRSVLGSGPAAPGGPAGVEGTLLAFVALALVLLAWLATAGIACLWFGRRILRTSP